MRLYSKTHEWFDTSTKEVGITNFAAEELGDIVYVGLPEIDDEVVAGEQFADIESVKAVAEIYSPVSAIVADVNEKAINNPALVNENAEKCWLIRVVDDADTTGLMTREEYEQFILEH